MKKMQLYLLATVLILGGAGLFLYKYAVFDFPLKSDLVANYWEIEARLTFNASNGPIKARLFLPPGETGRYLVETEHFLSGRYGLTTQEKNGNRSAVWSIRKPAGRQHLYYRVVVQKIPEVPQNSKEFKPPIVPRFDLSEVEQIAAGKIWKDVYGQSADMDTIVGNLFKKLGRPEFDENVLLLVGKDHGSNLTRLKWTVRILSLAGIPARLVNGVNLRKDSKADMVSWLEVFYQKKWHSYEAERGIREIPENYLAWWRGESPLYKITGGMNMNPQIHVTVQKNEISAVDHAVRQAGYAAPWFLKFSLFNLPVQNQTVYRVLLMMPIGALVIVVLRNVIGFSTLGTFMPVLIALSFRETRLVWGLILFSAVVALGLCIRFYLEQLKLLVVARLSAILICVIAIIAGLNILTHNLGMSLGLSVSLFPIVILSMAIERMSILWDERGPFEAIKQGVGTLVAAVIIYYPIKNPALEHVMFFFPEIILIILALTLLLGRYSGFRLLELYRFKEFETVKKR